MAKLLVRLLSNFRYRSVYQEHAKQSVLIGYRTPAGSKRGFMGFRRLEYNKHTKDDHIQSSLSNYLTEHLNATLLLPVMVTICGLEMWEFSKIRGLNIDPRYQGSYYKDTHRKDPKLWKQPCRPSRSSAYGASRSMMGSGLGY